MISVKFPQFRFEELTGRGARNLIHENVIVGEPEFGELGVEVRAQFVFGHGFSFFNDDRRQRPFGPFRMPS